MAARKLAALVLLWALLLTAAYDAVLAFGWVSIGIVPGAGAPGQDAAVVVSLVAMIASGVLVAARPTPLALVLPPAALLVVVARYYTFDPYYAPSLRRLSEGEVSVWWLVALGVASCAVSLFARRASLAAVVLFVAAGTLLVEGVGH